MTTTERCVKCRGTGVVTDGPHGEVCVACSGLGYFPETTKEDDCADCMYQIGYCCAFTDARNRETKAPTTKPLTALADHLKDCRAVWECVTGEPWNEGTRKISEYKEESLVLIRCGNDAYVYVYANGNIYGQYRVNGRWEIKAYNPFALVALLNRLGYGPQTT